MKKLFLIAVLIFPLFSISAQTDSFNANENWHFDAKAQFGMRYGQINEKNWYNASNGDTSLLSLLEWEMKPVFYAGGIFAFGYKGWNFDFGFKKFFNASCGTTFDSDWQNDYLSGNGDVYTKTNLSKNENFLTNGFEFETIASMTFHPSRKFALRPDFGLCWSYMSFEAKDGEYWYGRAKGIYNGNVYYYSWDSDEQNVKHEKTTNGETILEYSSSMLYLWTDIELSCLPTDFFTLNFYFGIAPFTFFYATDHHPLRTDLERKYFINIACGAFSSYRSSVEAVFNFKNNLTLGLKFSGLVTLDFHGVEYNGENRYGTYYKVSNSNVGGNQIWFDTSLTLGYRW